MRRSLVAPVLGLLLISFGCGDSWEGGGPDAGRPKEDASIGDTVPWDGDSLGDTGPTDGEPTDADVDASANDADTAGRFAPKIVLMIGDGMGPEHVKAASLYAVGRPDGLAMQALPSRGHIITASLSGLTDSAASATAMATGVKTINGYIGVDRHGKALTSITEVAKRLGMGTGVVSTASLPHATPAGFSAHHQGRTDYVEIANDQARNVRPDVMLGGGLRFYLPAGGGSVRDDEGLIRPLELAGYTIVKNRTELMAASSAAKKQILGLFADEHMPYVYDLKRMPGLDVPSLSEMAMAAVHALEQNPRGFFLMIEGAKIDMASHSNALPEPDGSVPGRWLDRVVDETLAFDQAVSAVTAWAKRQENATVLVTADHECGGLEVLESNGQGQLPRVSWRYGNHTNARVDLFGLGPGSETFDDDVRDNTWIHSMLKAQATAKSIEDPKPGQVTDGHLADLRHLASKQNVKSGFGTGLNQLDRLWLDADSSGLSIGVEGLFQWKANTLIVLLDVDLGEGTGPSELRGALSDRSKSDIDRVISSLTLLDPQVPGFGVDFVVAIQGGATAQLESMIGTAGLRGIRAPFGAADNFGWFPISTNFGEGVLLEHVDRPKAGEGWETHIPWSTLYPEANGGVPPGATLGVSTVLVNTDGGFTSNQALPPFPSQTENPGRAGAPLPGIVAYRIDVDGDGQVDRTSVPERRP